MADGNSNSIYSNKQIKLKKNKIKVGSLKHPAASSPAALLNVCKGPLKPSIFIYIMLDCTHTYMCFFFFTKSVCDGVLWQLKAFSGFSLHAGGHRQQPHR